MYRRVLIVGGTGSGKTTFAGRLSNILSIPYYTTDNMVYKKIGKEKYGDGERNRALKDICKKRKWIIEGVHDGEWINPAFEKADFVIILDTKILVSIKRVICRYFVGRKEHYTSLKNLAKMVYWSSIYPFDSGPKHRDLIKKNSKRFIILKNSREIDTFLESLS